MSSEMGDKKSAVLSEIVEMIKSGEYPTGSRLPSERELAGKLGIGRNVLREALAVLVAKGYLETKERQGLFVKNAGASDISGGLLNMQMLPVEFMPMQMEIRMIICVPAIEIAAIRRTDQDLARMWDCYEQFVGAPHATHDEEESQGKWEALLHHLQTEAAHNPLLSRVNESISALIEKNNSIMHHYTMRDAGWYERIKTQHRQMIEAIERQDPRTAGDVYRIHLLESYELMKKNYPELATPPTRPFWEHEKLRDIFSVLDSQHLR